MKFWRRSTNQVAEAEIPAGNLPVPSWPKIDEPATRLQMRDIAMKRLRAHREEQAAREASYPARLAKWEAGIAAEIQSRIPAMVEILKDRYPYGVGISLDRVWFGTYEEEQSVKIQSAPERPLPGDGYWERRQQAIIAFLDMLTEEELTQEHRLILQQMGASYD